MFYKKLFAMFLSIVLLAFGVPTIHAATTGGYLGADQWKVESDGDIVPESDSDYDIGASGSEVQEIFVDALTLGGVQKSSWGSVVSPMTDYSGYVAPTDAGSKLKLHDDGDLTLGGTIATDVAITFDGNAQDFYLALDDSADQVKLGYGSVIGTTSMLGLGAGRSLYISDNTTNDFQIVLDGGAQDFHIGIDDTGGAEEDLLCIGRGASVGTTDDLMVGKASGTVYVNALDAPGNVDFDIGSADVDDVTVVTDGGTLILDGTITLTDSEVISNATDDTVRVASNDAAVILEAYTPGTSNEDASVRLTADAGADAGDIFQLTHDGATNDLLIQNDTSAKGTPATVFTIAETGIVTTTNYIDNKITDTTNNAVIDVIKLTHDGGAAATGVGTGLSFQVDDAGGIEEQASIDTVLTTVTDAAEDADVVVSQNTAGTVAETLRLVAASSATVSDYLQFTANTTETDAATNVLVLKTATGTATDNYGMSISFQPEDATGSEEVASLDIIQTTAARATNDTDFVFSQNINGTITETVRIDADAGIDLTATGFDITFANDESINNDTDDTVQFVSEDEAMVIEALGFEAKEAQLVLSADQDDDATDGWELAASTSGTLTIGNDSAVAGTFVDKVTVDGATGNLTLTGDIINENADTLVMSTDDVLSYQSNDGASAIQAYGFEANEGAIQIVADEGDDATDGWELAASTSGTLTIGNDSAVAGTFVDKVTIDGATGNVTMTGTATFSGGQTRKVTLGDNQVVVDGANAPATTDLGTNAQALLNAWSFDADGGATGDDLVFLMWQVPDGYVADSARLNVYWSFSTAEDAADEAVFDCTVNAVGEGEAWDAAGTGVDAVTTTVADASADNDKLFIDQINIEVEDIAVDDTVVIMFWADEDASALANSGTADVHAFEIEYESTE